MSQRFIVSVMFAMFLIGCQSQSSTAPAQQTPLTGSAAELNKIGLAVHNYEMSFNKAPSTAADLQPFLRDTEVEKSAYQKLAQGDIVLYWNVTVKGLKSIPANTVLGYEKNVPTSGGLVLMGSSEVKTMTASEFAAKPKAEKK